jgi:WD40 repeat protein
VAITPDGKRALSSGDDSNLRLWDLDTGRALGKWQGHNGAVFTLALSADGNSVVSGGSDGRLIWWEVPSGKIRTRWGSKCVGHISAVAFGDDSVTVWVGGEDGSIRLWAVGSGGELKELPPHNHPVRGLQVVREGRQLVAAHADGQFRVFDTDHGKELQSTSTHTPITGLGVTVDGRQIVAVGGHTMRVWDLKP